MKKLLKPDIFNNSVYEIDLNLLYKKGIKGLAVDIDNTLTLWKAAEMESQVRKWLKSLIENGFKVCLLSNGKSERINRLLLDLNINYISQAKKPTKKGFTEALKILGTTPYETAMIGDQIFTDILGANRVGFTTILVEPLDRGNEFLITKLLRIVEKIILRRKAA